MSDTLTVNGIEYIRADTAPAGPPTDHRIIVADRGWVFVGPASTDDNGDIVISPAKCIRYWGTDSAKPGLGYLAMNGPTDKTKLDASGTVRIPANSLVASFDTDGSKWA